ncbi:MAG: 7-carboxy-7-deazaguanine synthase QueE [Aphanocapsa sp. GSE-SYN-MK-11-07L]|jgi:organic radical activating enzyme|nr:7-carboxy-7-deazaguanine synthase QueE [Aphanocapsa sp. GSE-SYN-MK-11-07L]
MVNFATAPAQVSDPPDLTAALVEVFSAIQGEGLNVGTRQIFIRFGICDLRCRFCDSAHTWKPSQTCQIERSPGERDFLTANNPVTSQQLLDWVNQQNQPGLHDSISLTGGEPLLHAEFLAQFLPLVRDRTGLPIYLETAGHLPLLLQPILPYLDAVGMDIKLPSVSGESHWSAHSEFLRCCHSAKLEVFCKLIVSAQTQTSDLVQARQLVAEVHPAIPVFLQPVTPLGTAKDLTAPRPEQVLAWQALMKANLKSVRVIPQTHKAIGQL